jgi:hypothetical protein
VVDCAEVAIGVTQVRGVGMFTRSGAKDDTMSLVETWQALGARYGLDVTSSNSQAIVASGMIRGRMIRVDIHRNRKASEPFQGMAEKRRRMKMRHHWTTELTVACANPHGLQGAVQTFTDIRDPAWKPLDADWTRCRVVRTEPASLARHVLDASIHERLHGMTGDQQILVEPTQIRLTVDDTSEQVENGFFTGSPLHVEYPGPWPATFRERALVGPPWWFDLLCDIADAVDASVPDATAASSPFVSAAGSSWARSGGPFDPDGPSGDGRGKLVAFALLAGALVIAGVVAFALTRPSSDAGADAGAAAVETAGTSPSAEEAAATPQAPDDPTAVQVGELFTGAAIATLIDEIAVANGTEPMQLLSVLVYPEYLTAQGQGPGAEQSIIEYRWVGQLTPATPAPAVPTDDLTARLFGSDEVAWSAIPALVEAAPAAVAVEGGVVTHLDVERSLPFSDDIRIRVFVAGPGGGGFVDGDATGSMISINGN